MKRKISILTISIVLTIILFSISTYLQKKIVKYEPTIKCYVANEDIEENEKISDAKIRLVEVPIPLVLNMQIVQSKEDLENLYANSKIFSGQILIKNQFDTKENLSIFEGEEGKEKISLKIKSAENGVSYRLREKSKINVYAVLRSEYANNIFANSSRQYIGTENDGYCSIKILENVSVIGIFDNYGVQIQNNSEEDMPDTIMISVTSEEAQDINLIRNVATFNFTEIEEARMHEDLPG